MGAVKIPVDRLPEGAHVEQWYALKGNSGAGRDGAGTPSKAAVKLRLRLVVQADPSLVSTASPMADAAAAAAALAAMASPAFGHLPPPPPPEPSRSPPSLQPGLPSPKFAGGLLRKPCTDAVVHPQPVCLGAGRHSPAPAFFGPSSDGLPSCAASAAPSRALDPGVLAPKALSTRKRISDDLGPGLQAEPLAHAQSPGSGGGSAAAFGAPSPRSTTGRGSPPPDAVRADAGWWRRQVIASGLVDFVAVREANLALASPNSTSPKILAPKPQSPYL